MNIIDIKDNLQKKLNKAIVTAIANKQANGEFTPLEGERDTYRFYLQLDTGAYRGYEYLKKNAGKGDANGNYTNFDFSEFPTQKYVQFINGNIAIVDSDVEGGVAEGEISEGVQNYSFTANVTFIIPIISQDVDATELIGTIRTVIDNAMSLNTYADFEGYNMSVVYTLGRTGERMVRPGVGDSITLDCSITYGFVGGGINSTQIAIIYGDTTIYTPSKALSRRAAQEGDADLSSNDNAMQNTTYSTSFTLSFNKPLQSGDFDKIALDFLIDGDRNKVYPIIIQIQTGTATIRKVMRLNFNDVEVTGAGTLNAALRVVMGNGVLLDG